MFESDNIFIMADNWLEKKFEEYSSGKTKEQKAKERAWKKRMDAYKKKLAAEKVKAEGDAETAKKAKDETGKKKEA